MKRWITVLTAGCLMLGLSACATDDGDGTVRQQQINNNGSRGNTMNPLEFDESNRVSPFRNDMHGVNRNEMMNTEEGVWEFDMNLDVNRDQGTQGNRGNNGTNGNGNTSGGTARPSTK